MRFSLHYRGVLEPNGSRDHKHVLRRHFHEQLENVWIAGPLQSASHLLKPPDEHWFGVYRERFGHIFAPLVTEQMLTTAELDISILWPHGAGTPLHGGDIDNRLKTLFDALCPPPQANALPDDGWANMPTPFFTLLEDDKLVSSVRVRTATLWEPVAHQTEVDLLLDVTVRAERVVNGNMMFAG